MAGAKEVSTDAAVSYGLLIWSDDRCDGLFQTVANDDLRDASV